MNTDILTTDTDDGDVLPPANKKNWLKVYAFLACIAALCLMFIILYRQMPKKSAPVTKRTIPATRNIFAMVLSPVNADTANAITKQIASEVGADSNVTQMIIGGTAVHKRCMSLADFSNLTNRALAEAQPEVLKRQALLLSHVAGVVTADTLPTTLYIIGKVDEGDFEPIEKRIEGATRVMGSWNAAFKNIRVVTYIQPASSPHGDSIRSAFIGMFRKAGHVVTERPMTVAGNGR